MPAKKTVKKAQKEPEVEPFVRCGDCDAVLPVDTEVCPNCGYEI
jgi:rRNA maturation endonuclease Nob1